MISRVLSGACIGLFLVASGAAAAEGPQYEIASSFGFSWGNVEGTSEPDYTVLSLELAGTYFFKPLADDGQAPLALTRFYSQASFLFIDLSVAERIYDDSGVDDDTGHLYGGGGEAYFGAGTGVGAAVRRIGLNRDEGGDVNTTDFRVWVDQYFGRDHKARLALVHQNYSGNDYDGSETVASLSWTSVLGGVFLVSPSVGIGTAKEDDDYYGDMDWTVYHAGLELAYFFGRQFALYVGGEWTRHEGDKTEGWYDSGNRYEVHVEPEWWFGPEGAISLDIVGARDERERNGMGSDRTVNEVSALLRWVARF